MRSLWMNGLFTVAATRDDWCQAVVELTTAIRTGCSGLAWMPDHSLARAYEAIAVAHSCASLGTTLFRPELPEVAETQYRPANGSLPSSRSRYACRSARRSGS
jgi:hypothetical protein